jgi:hypothetical protein
MVRIAISDIFSIQDLSRRELPYGCRDDTINKTGNGQKIMGEPFHDR